MITIIVPTYNEEQYIIRLLLAIISYPSVNEILIVDGMSIDNTRNEIEAFIKSNKNNLKCSIRVIDNIKRLQGYALNLGIKEAKNPILIRLDAHSIVDSFNGNDHFQAVAELLNKKNYCLIGFKQRFMFSNEFQASIHILSCTPFLSKSLYRYVNKNTSTRDTAWLFSILKDDAINNNLFIPERTPNEDYDFNQRLICKTSKPLMIYPYLPIYYQPRNTLLKLFIQYFRYGKARYNSEINLQDSISLLLYTKFFILSLFSILISFIIIILLFSSFSFYLSLLSFILLFYILQFVTDSKIYTRRFIGFDRNLLSLIIGLFLSPFISFIPLLSRSIGFLFSLFLSLLSLRKNK